MLSSELFTRFSTKAILDLFHTAQILAFLPPFPFSGGVFFSLVTVKTEENREFLCFQSNKHIKLQLQPTYLRSFYDKK